jgi:hypothetical protein
MMGQFELQQLENEVILLYIYLYPSMFKSNYVCIYLNICIYLFIYTCQVIFMYVYSCLTMCKYTRFVQFRIMYVDGLFVRITSIFVKRQELFKLLLERKKEPFS